MVAKAGARAQLPLQQPSTNPRFCGTVNGSDVNRCMPFVSAFAMPNADLFAAASRTAQVGQPLAERMRPRHLDDIVGQMPLLGPQGILRTLLLRRAPFSCILSGPPGTGKTTLGLLMADSLGAEFVSLSAVSAGIKELREAAERATLLRNHRRVRTVLFIDEIHRFHRGQQDALLPHVESGLFTLIGATTENPHFALNRALMSRCRSFCLDPLTDDDIIQLLARALGDAKRGLGQEQVTATQGALPLLAQLASGDARRALALLEAAVHRVRADARTTLAVGDVQALLESAPLPHDRAGEAHYDLASALIKSMRSGDETASVYYLARMLEAGEAPSFVWRRMAIFAHEDIGMAQPQAASVVAACAATFERVGMPEGWLPLTHAAMYLARAPKSRDVVAACERARQQVHTFGALAPPPHMLNSSVLARTRKSDESPTSQRHSCLPLAMQNQD